ncbi:MAG TPA: hypothetical protein VEO01_28940 [Pseudonocardiaceae bacterium]|nr:hypothetical protein [Pseudonocardiaceae bacterium]
MTTPRNHNTHTRGLARRPTNDIPTGPGGYRGHHWMMLACCVPMLAIAGILVATGVVGVGFLVVAVMCTAMMALMMGGMNHGQNGR